MEKAIRMPRRNEEWKRQTECQEGMRNGKDEQNAEKECGIKKRQTECQEGMGNEKGKQNVKQE